MGPKQGSFTTDILMLLMATPFGKDAPKYGAKCNDSTLKYAVKFTAFRNVGDTEEHLLCYFLNTVAFCALCVLVVEIDNYWFPDCVAFPDPSC